MVKRFENSRMIRRLEPRHAATAAVLHKQNPWDSQQLDYGLLTNVSVTGACIATDSYLAPGSRVDIKVSFYQQLSLFEIAARVAWSRRAGAHETGFEGLSLHGVQFAFSSTLQKSRLHALLASQEFEDVFRLPSIRFTDVMGGLAGDLDERSSKMRETTVEEIVAGPSPTSEGETSSSS